MAIMHRFIPALTSWNGARIAEVPIKNIPRPQNASNYGLSRTWRVMADLLTVRFLLKYVTRPLHLFGPLGFACVGAGAGAAAWILLTKLVTGAPIFLAHGPLLLLSAVLVQTGTSAGRSRTARRTADAHLHGRRAPAHLHRCAEARGMASRLGRATRPGIVDMPVVRQ